MQQMDLFDNLDFGPFQALARMVKAPNFDISTITTLDFSNTKYPNVPSYKILEKFTELRVILLNNTGLSRFDSQNLLKGAPLLREINLSGNNITEFDDIVELGKLKYLQTLNLQDNPISKNYIRVKFLEFLLFPSKYRPYNPVKIFTATYEQIPNKASVTAESVAENNKFYRFLEKGDEEMKFEAAANTLVSKYDHQKTIIKLSAEMCPVPRKTNFPMLTLLNNEKITIQNLQSILMTNDISSILEIYEEEDKAEEAREKEIPKRKNKRLHKKYIKDYLRRKMRKEFIAEQEDKKKMNFDTLDDDPLKTLDMWKQKIGPDGKVLKNIDYQKELWKRPADLEHKDAEFNIGISEYKQMVREYEDMKKQKSGRKMNEEEEKEYKEIRKLFPEKKKRKDNIKIKFGGETNYTVEQNTSDSDVQEDQDEDEKEEWHESDFWFDSDDDEMIDPNIWEDLSTLSKRSSSSPMNKRSAGASPSNNIARMLKRMSIMKGMHQKNKESDQSKGGDMVIQEEENEENTNREKEKMMMGKIRIPNLVPSMDREEFEQIIDKINKVTEEDDRRKNMSKTFQNQTRKARTFLVKRENKPNLSLPMYPRVKDETAIMEKSQEPEQQQQLTERVRREATPVSIVSEKKLEENKGGLQRGASDLDLLKALVDNKGSIGMFITQQISAKQSSKFMINNEEKEAGKIGIQDTAYDRVAAKKINLRGGSFDREFIESLQPTSSYNHTVGPTDYSDSKIKPREEVKPNKMLGERRGSSKILEGIVRGGGSQSTGQLLPKNPQTIIEKNDKETFIKETYQKALSFLTNSVDHQVTQKTQKTQKTTTTIALEDSDPLYAIKFQAYVNSPSPDNQSTMSPVNNNHNQNSTPSYGTMGPYFRTPIQTTTANKILNFPGITPNKKVKSFIPGLKNNFETPEKTENPDPKNHRDKKQVELRKKAQKAWENDRGEIPTIKPIKPPKTPNKNSQITPHNRSASNLKTPLRANHQIKSAISHPQLLNLPSSEGRMVPAERLHSQTGGENSIYGTRSPLTLLSLESPTHLYYGKGAEEISNKSLSTLPNLPSYDQSPINRKIAPIQHSKGATSVSNNPNMIISILNHMNGKGKEIKGIGGRVIKFTDSIYIQNGERATTAAPRTLVEDLIPGPEAGIPAKKKMGMLHSGYSRYNKILETAKMLDDTTKIIEDSKELADNVIKTCKFKKRVRGNSAIKPREPREISYEELTQFLRLYKGQEKLTFDDDRDVRRLADAINDYELQDNKGMKMTEVEQKLRKLRDETLKLEGAALEAKFKEIERCREYLELLENIEEHRDAVRNSNRVGKLQAQEIERAEHNAILAVHYMKLRKYCDSEYLGQFMNSDFKAFESMQEARMNGNNAGETQEQQENSRANRGPALYKGKKPNLEEEEAKISARKIARKQTQEKEFEGKEKGIKKQESLMEYIEKVNEEKKAILKEYPYGRQESQPVDDQHQWLHYSPVAKFEIKPMLGIEALMEEEMRKKQSAYTKSSSRMMTTEEKAVQYAEEFKEGLKERKVLKNRVEKYIKQGTVHIDEMLESEKREIDERNNKKKMFREYMNMLYEKNKGTVAQSPRSSLNMMMMSGVLGVGSGAGTGAGK